MSGEIENLRRDVRMRMEYDKMMSTAWLLIYLIPVIMILIAIPAMFLAPAIIFLTPILGIISFIVSIVLVLSLIHI